VLGLALTIAAGPAGADGPVLHEYVRARPPGGPAALVGAARPGMNPQAIRQDGRLVPAPADPPQPRAGEATLRALPRGGVALDRATSFAPDRSTRADDTLTYREVFNPSVVPFKRGQALDLVRPDGTLGVAERRLRPVPVGGQPGAEAELFFGSVVVDLSGGPVPLPSVAPQVRILSYEAEPRVPLTFWRDGADNSYVQGPARRGPVRLTWLSEVPSSYFAGVVPDGVGLGDVPAAWLRPVPAALRARAARVAQRVGVDARMPVRLALDRLVEYFRGFEPGVLPPVSGDLYLDLALGRRGVCRHRSYAFVVTAQALGLPARFVANEAHAFVEVRVPRLGWRRIDLGGAAAQLEVGGMSDKIVHRPRVADPFPQPPAYTRRRTSGAEAVRGLRDAQLRDLAQARGGSGAGAARGPGGRGPGAPGAGPGGRSAQPSDGAPVPPAPSAAPTLTRLRHFTSSGYRGDPLTVTGHVTLIGGGAAAGLTVAVVLRRAGGGPERRLGTLLTDVAGRFEGTLNLPPDLDLGDYRVVAVTAGDERRLGSSSE
jgi:transglutaminase-like putative cysteine protease